MNFDNEAKEWDNARRIERAVVIADEMRKSLGDTKDKSALEFGCGTGLISFNLKDDFKDITLLDLSQEMINVLNDKIKTSRVSNMKSMCCDLFDTKIEKQYDVLYCSMVLHHIIEVEKTFDKFYDVLKIGGKLCVVDLDEDGGALHRDDKDFDGHNGFSQKWMRSLLKKKGFGKIESHTFHKCYQEILGQQISYTLFIMTAEKL